MKLNYKRTVLVGLAFFLICAFWQAYDNTIPLILTNKFGMSQALSGVIMALDNILALFMLPLFGAISDRSKSPRGRRTPFILWGTIVAVAAFVSLSLVDAAQLKNLGDVAKIDDPAALSEIYELERDATLQTPDGQSFVLGDVFTEEEFTQITSQIQGDEKTVTNPDYTNYVTPARQAVAHQIARDNPSTLILFIALLLITLIAMATFRSPAVALMPDVTIKPLRSKANAVINLMGSAGGILVLALGMVFATSSVKNSLMSYKVYFGVIGAVMLLALVIFLLTVKEPKLVKKMHEDSKRFGIEEDEPDAEPGASRGLSAGEKKSLLFILASIVLWFMGYNAVTHHRAGRGDHLVSPGRHRRLQGRPQEDDPRRRRDARRVLRRGGVPPFGEPHHADEPHVRPRGHRLGDDQRQLLPDGRGALLRRGRGQIHRILLHRQYGRAGRHAHVLGLPDGPYGHDRPLPLRHDLCGARVRHDAVRPPRRQPSRGREGARGA